MEVVIIACKRDSGGSLQHKSRLKHVRVQESSHKGSIVRKISLESQPCTVVFRNQKYSES